MGFEKPLTPNTRAPSLYPRNPVTNPLNGLLDTAEQDMPPAFTPQTQPVGYPPAVPPMPDSGVRSLPPVAEAAPQQRQSVWNYPSSGGKSPLAGLLDESVYEPMAVRPVTPAAPAPDKDGYIQMAARGMAGFNRHQYADVPPIDPLTYRSPGRVVGGRFAG